MLTNINESRNPLLSYSLAGSFYEKDNRHAESIKHPVAKMQDNFYKKEQMKNMRKFGDLYGSALPLQLTIERNALANMNREGPMKSNNFGLNIHTGFYDKMSFNDYIGVNRPFDVDQNLSVFAKKFD